MDLGFRGAWAYSHLHLHRIYAKIQQEFATGGKGDPIITPFKETGTKILIQEKENSETQGKQKVQAQEVI